MRHESLMRELGTHAPDFALPDPDGRIYTLQDFANARGLLVAFVCNHCPFVKHILPAFVQFTAEYKAKGLATVAISSNDVVTFPDDSPAEIKKLSEANGFSFPYLYDESQDVARSFGAVCTPDFFMYDAERKLYYRGQFDSSRPVTQYTSGNGPATGADVRAAADALLVGLPAPEHQVPSMGCNIKWKAGQEPAWA